MGGSVAGDVEVFAERLVKTFQDMHQKNFMKDHADKGSEHGEAGAPDAAIAAVVNVARCHEGFRLQLFRRKRNHRVSFRFPLGHT